MDDYKGKEPAPSVATELIAAQFARDLSAQQARSLREYLGEIPQAELREAFRQLLLIEMRFRRELGEIPVIEDYTEYLDDFAVEVHDLFCDLAETRPARIDTSQENDVLGVAEDDTPEMIGKYRIISRIGKGGQARVFRALHPGLLREVVLKIGDQSSAIEDIVAEGRVLAELDHANVARIFDVDVYRGRPFLVCEYVRGRNLQQFAAQHPLTPLVSAQWIAKLARGLAVAHALGVIHRDLKPANIMIDAEHQPKLIDFGLARWNSGYDFETCGPRAIQGTLPFMPPEQARADFSQIGPRSDIFGLGAVFYWMLTGQPPFMGSDWQEVLRHASQCQFDQELLSAQTIPREMRKVCLRAMATDPAERFSSAEDFAEALEQCTPKQDRRKWLIGVVAATLFALVAAGGFLWRSGVDDHTSSPRSSLRIVVWQKDKPREFEDAVPLHTNDDLRVVFTCPTDYEASLFWLDSEGKLHLLAAQRVDKSGDQSDYIWPSSTTASRIAGPPGCEVIFACANTSRAPRLQDLQKFMVNSWPQLPEKAYITFNSNEARISSTRAPGETRERTAGNVVDMANLLREKLAERYSLVQGVAFSHVDP